MGLSWFGVKTLFRSRAVGSPRTFDSAFDPDVDCVEERVVLFRARTFDDAIARAETEARRYAKTTHRNPYGQAVVTRYLGSCDAFKLFEAPAAGIEVFSSMVLVPATEGRRALVDRWFGPSERVPDKRRRKFLNREFSGEVRAASNKALQPTSRKARRQKLLRPRSARG
jgi:hypothetical protein